MSKSRLVGHATRLPLLLALLGLVPGCAIKRHWHSSERKYDQWALEQCVKTHRDLGMTEDELVKFCDPNWKPCKQGDAVGEKCQ